MENAIVRINKVEIQNFKNVKHGVLSFENTRKEYEASILGLYGQNGSGKTTLIDVISLLKQILVGLPVQKRFSDYINVDSEAAKIVYTLNVTDTEKNTTFLVNYEITIRKGKNENYDGTNEKYITVITDEVLSYSCDCKNGKVRVMPIMDTRNSEIFTPKTKLKALTNNNKNAYMDLKVAKEVAKITSTSYLFSNKFLKIIDNNCSDEKHKFIIRSLVEFGRSELFVIDTSHSGLISLNALPLAFKKTSAAGEFPIPLNEPSLVPENMFRLIEKIISDMNVVLEKIVPGLTIGTKKLSNRIMQEGIPGVEFQLVSYKNDKQIALQYESEGIKKIISILHLLISVYNRKSVTVAIDELDSGIFEYLLGELLYIISEKGKGQLIFTSHNLRPLETIDRGFVAFTTTNPEKRYVRMVNVKENNNLRSYYFRDIILGGQDNELYKKTDNYKISFAFRSAGEAGGLIG